MILDGTLKDGEYKFYEDLGNGWVEEIKPPISAYGSINIDELNQVIERLKKIPNYDELIRDSNKKAKEIERLNNIIEKIEEALRTRMYPDIARNEALSIINKSKQLKEGK